MTPPLVARCFAARLLPKASPTPRAGRHTRTRPNGLSARAAADLVFTLAIASAAPAAAQAPASGARLRLVRSGVEGAAVTAPTLPVVDTMPARRVGPPCGTARACAAAWDLRVVRISSADSVGAGGILRTTITIENAGRLAAPASEVLLCVTTGGTAARSRQAAACG